MLMRLLALVLETVFMLLMGAALLRAYMNGLRVNMLVQPGVFVMALTNWLVKPLRRWLPQALVGARLDSTGEPGDRRVYDALERTMRASSEYWMAGAPGWPHPPAVVLPYTDT